MQEFDDIAHFVMQLAQQQQEPRLIGFGHVTSYDPKRHLVKVALPSFNVLDPQTGAVASNPIISPWMQLGSPWAGDGWGFQGAPNVGGTGPDNYGTQCAIFAVDNNSSVSFTATMLYTNVELPPDATLLPGEAVLQHQTGTKIKLKSTGDLDIYVQSQLSVTNAAGLSVVADAQGSVAITLPGGQTFSINGLEDALALVSKLVNAFNSHTHNGVQSGGSTSGTPVTTWSASTIESALVKVGS